MSTNTTTEKDKESRIPWSDLTRISPRQGLLQRAEKVWWFVLLSLPVDLMVIDFVPQLPMADVIFGLLVLASFVSLWRRKLFIAGLAATKLRRRLFQKTGKWTPFLLLGVMGVFILIEVFSKGDSGSGALFGTIISLVIGLIGLLPAYRAIKEKLKSDSQRNKNRLLALRYLEDQAFGLCVASLVPARLLSTAGILAFSEFQYLPTILSLALLVLLRPRVDDFEIYCVRCYSKTSIAFSGVPYCHACSRKAFRQKPQSVTG